MDLQELSYYYNSNGLEQELSKIDMDNINKLQTCLREKFNIFRNTQDYNSNNYYYVTLTNIIQFDDISSLMDYMVFSKKEEYGMPYCKNFYDDLS